MVVKSAAERARRDELGFGAMTQTVVRSEGVKAKGVPVNPTGRIPELDGLRGLAILLVIICHYVANAEHKQLGFWVHRALSGLTFGWSGVDLFFVLSGFLIGGILVDARSAPHYFRAFYMRRVHRILPVYYSWILIYAAVVCAGLWLLPGRLPFTTQDLKQVPIYLFFLQNLRLGMPPAVWIWFGVMWSLAVEEQFYLLAPPLIRILSIHKLVVALTATVCIAPLLRFVVFGYLSPGTYTSTMLMPCRADTLAMGMLLAIAWRAAWFRAFLVERRVLLQDVLLVLTLGVGGLLWWFAHPLSFVTVIIGYTWLAFFYGCLLLVVLSQTQGWIAGVMRWKILRGLGTISYCVYVIHLTFNHLAHQILLHAEPQVYNAKGVGVTLLALVLTLAVASLSWRYFEKPLIRRGHSYSYWQESVQTFKGLSV
jgi:peptidoglycan/LPS O-acetylase OafA/YrhL